MPDFESVKNTPEVPPTEEEVARKNEQSSERPIVSENVVDYESEPKDLNQLRAKQMAHDQESYNKALKEIHEMNARSRRQFLKIAGAGAASLALGSVMPLSKDVAKELFFDKDMEKSILEKQKYLKELYGIDVRLNDPGRETFSSSEARLAQKERGLQLLIEELAKLPPLVIKDSPLVSVALQSDIRYKKHGLWERLSASVGGYVMTHLHGGKQTRSNREMFLNIGGNISNGYNLFGWKEGDVRNAFAHEMFHAFDTIDEDEWTRLHEGKDMYAKSDRSRALTLAVADMPTPGFARFYGRMNHFEDKATIYESFSSREAYAELVERSLSDRLLSQKITVIQAFMKKMSCGLMDQHYWLDVLDGKVDDSYFRKKAEQIVSADAGQYRAKNPSISAEEFGRWQEKLRQEYGFQSLATQTI